MRRLLVSIDEMARDARTLAGEEPRAWADAFRRLLAAYGWRIERGGPVYFHGRHTILDNWLIVPVVQS